MEMNQTMADAAASETAPVQDAARRDDDADGDVTLYFNFVLGRETFGMPVSTVKEVILYGGVFKTPGVPDFIRGVINLRGEVVPVIDLTCRFYGYRAPVTESTCIAIVEVRDENNMIPVGVMIDNVKAVTGIPGADMSPAPEIGSRIRQDFVHAIGKVDGQFVIILNVDKVIDLQELSEFESNGRRSKRPGGGI